MQTDYRPPHPSGTSGGIGKGPKDASRLPSRPGANTARIGVFPRGRVGVLVGVKERQLPLSFLVACKSLYKRNLQKQMFL